MKKKWTPVFVIAGIVLLLFGGVAGIQLVQRYMPSKNQADIGELLGITDDASQAAIYLNGELQEEKGLVDGEQMYLPVTWVDEYVKKSFTGMMWRKCWYIHCRIPVSMRINGHWEAMDSRW